MLRLIALAALVACGGAPDRVQHATSGPTRLIAFVEPGARDGSSADFALVLPGGDWLVIVDGKLARLSPDGEDVRWTKRGIEIWDAVIVRDRVIAAGHLAEPTAPNQQLRSVFALELSTGAIAWKAISDPITRGARATVVHVGDITVAASAYGETGIDDTGHVRWTESHREAYNEPMLAVAPQARTAVVATTRAHSSSEFGPEPLRSPVTIRTFDVETGVARGRVELAPTGDYFALEDVARAGDGRIAIRATDVRMHAEVQTIEGERTTVVSAKPTSALLVIDSADAAAPTVRATVTPAATPAETTLAGRLAPTEVAFLERYATPKETLGLAIEDLATGTTRRAIVMRPQRVVVGETIDSFVQVLRLVRDGDRLSFAGMFSGVVKPLHAVVEEIDRCEAEDFIECSEGGGVTTIAPSAGFVGAIDLTR